MTEHINLEQQREERLIKKYEEELMEKHLQWRTLEQLRECKPCYDPVKYLPEGWKGTVIDILNIENCPAEDRIWMVTRKGLFYTDRELRLFACECAERALSRIENPDPRSVEAIRVARLYANGEATKDELAAAYAAAAAAYAVAYAAAADAAAAAAAYTAVADAERKWQIERLKEIAKEGVE